MSKADSKLHELREAHQKAFFDAGDLAAALDLDASGPLRLDWLRFQIANEYFFPQHAHGQSRQQYRDNFCHREMKKCEFGSICDLETAGLLNLQHGRPAAGPAIYCSYHLGAWAIQPVLLLRRGIPMAIVAGPGMAQDHGGAMVQMNHQGRERQLWQAELSVISSDGSSALMQMMRALREGRSLYICIDGQRGQRGQMNAADEERHAVPIRFAGREILARMGAAYLAHKLGLPLVPMLSWREADGTVSAEIGEPIPPEGSREEFARLALQQLWTRFEDRTVLHARQWEMGWYSYRTRAQQRRMNAFEPQRLYRFNDDRYHLYEPAQGLLLDAQTDELKRVPPAYAGWMDRLRGSREGIPGQWLSQLFKDPQSLQQIFASELLVAQ